MKPHAVYFSACRWAGPDIRIVSTAAVVMAVDVAHATGQALEMARKVYPMAKGWMQHNTGAVPADLVTTIDDWQEYEEGGQG